MKKLIILCATMMILGCTTEESKRIPVYEVTGDFVMKHEPERTITLQGITYEFWSIKDAGTGRTVCLIQVRQDEKFKELHGE